MPISRFLSQGQQEYTQIDTSSQKTEPTSNNTALVPDNSVIRQFENGVVAGSSLRMLSTANKALYQQYIRSEEYGIAGQFE